MGANESKTFDEAGNIASSRSKSSGVPKAINVTPPASPVSPQWDRAMANHGKDNAASVLGKDGPSQGQISVAAVGSQHDTKAKRGGRKRVAKSPSTSQTNGKKTRKDAGEKDTVEASHLDIGSRVIARWQSKKDEWYVGTISKVYMDRRGEWRYSIAFDDGFSKGNVPRKHIVARREHSINDNLVATTENDPSKSVLTHQHLKVGMKVYARFVDNDQWYWGRIISIADTNSGQMCSVKFDDGDIRHEIPAWDELYTEEEYTEFLAK